MGKKIGRKMVKKIGRKMGRKIGRKMGKKMGRKMGKKIISYEYCLVFLFISDMQNNGDNFTVCGTRDPPPQRGGGKMSLKQIHTCRFCLLVADKS
jgi:hypothetical protein